MTINDIGIAWADMIRDLGHPAHLRFRPADDYIPRETFTVAIDKGGSFGVRGHGDTPQEAWDDAVAQLRETA